MRAGAFWEAVDASYAPVLVAVLAAALTPRRAYAQLLVLALLGLAVGATKRATGVLRPDGSDRRSFPSGHTAAAVYAAGLARWHPAAAAWALSVAASRVALKRHSPVDVAAGAALGALFARAA